MTKNNNIIELLAPAGSPESLIAAVAAGADAVYLGLSQYNARSSAVNFNEENLREYVEFCHVRGVRVYLTLNTILYQNEIQEAYEIACFAYNNGVDALIVQDSGLLTILRKELPEFELHASTQMSVNSEDGVKYMESQGISRVILPREMNLEAITKASSTSATTEVFVHGARCYSYSGQCLMSSMLGGRSGNRGNCAQPCRLPYKLVDESGNLFLKGHLLSLKDTIYIDSLSELKQTGVTSLKIEGRMKTPEYVYVVTSIYRKYLDMPFGTKISASDMDDLMKAFNREGFSKGALSQNPGKDEFSRKSPSNSGFPVGTVTKITSKGCFVVFNTPIDKSDGLKINSNGCYAGHDIKPGFNEFLPLSAREGDTVYRTKDFLFSKKYNLKNISNNRFRIPISAKFFVKSGENPIFILEDSNGNHIEAISDVIAEQAKSTGTSCERIKSQLLKTGDTPFDITSFDFVCDLDIYLKISHINSLRRKAFALLIEKRKGNFPSYKPIKLTTQNKGCPKLGCPKLGKMEISVCLYKIPAGLRVETLGVDRIYADASIAKTSLLDISKQCQKEGVGFFLYLPYSYSEAPNIQCDGYIVENHGMLRKLSDKKLILGTGFNITNSFSPQIYKNAEAYTLSYEMTEDNIVEFINSSSVQLEMVVYGKPQVMESPYCPARDICQGDLCLKNKLHITDRKDETWDMLFDPNTHFVRIFNSHRIMLTQSVPRILAAGLNRFRINIFDETTSEIHNIIEAVKTGTRPTLNPEYKYTRGHF